MKRIYLICSLAIFLGIAGGISYFLIRDANVKIPADATLINQNRNPYNFGKDHTKLKLVDFIYTNCPDICPTTTLKMADLEKDLIKAGVFGKKIDFITITIDPYRDTPEVLTKYMEGFGIPNNNTWNFLTGNANTIKMDEAKIKRIANALQFQYKDPGNGQFVHTTFLYLLDKNNKFTAKFPMGNTFDKKAVYEKIMAKINLKNS